MNMTNIIVYMLILFSGISLTVNEIISKVQAKYQVTENMSADFKQIQYIESIADTQVSVGKIWMKKPNKVRMEYSSPVEQTLVYDGEIVWNYVKQNKQVLKSKVSQEDNPIQIQELLFDYAGKYNIELIGKTNSNPICYHLSMKPIKENPYFTKLNVFIDEKEFITRKVEMIDVEGNSTIYDLTNIKLNTGIKDSTFIFVVPQGVEVVEMK